MTDRPHVLYRMRDRFGRLLYVGITLDPGTRFQAHRLGKSWWVDVASIELEHHASRYELRAAEEKAIRAESPLYNIQMQVPVGPLPRPEVKGGSSEEEHRSPTHRTIRGIEDDLWDDCVVIAKARAGGTDKRGALSAEIRSFLIRYVRTHKGLLDEAHDTRPET